MWDLLIIAAGTAQQKEDFELQLQNINLSHYANKVAVIDDNPPGHRIGAGGAMFSILRDLRIEYKGHLDQMKVLLIHSGGYSQRMPHLAPFGKIFGYLPGPKTVLQLKLDTYKIYSNRLAKGLLVAASDVIEKTSVPHEMQADTDMLLFANESHVKTASQHGVFVMEDGKLECVLQKPTREMMEETNAIMPNGLVLTDCFYWMSWKLCDQVATLFSENLSEEICCYGDFMRPLGTRPRLEYLNEGSKTLQQWRRAIANIFSKASVEVHNLGPDSFYHLGTFSEFREHINPSSKFSWKFLNVKSNNVFCRFEDCKIGDNVYAEFCNLRNSSIGANCILSNLESAVPVEIPANVAIFTFCTTLGYVTIAVDQCADMKKEQEQLEWMTWETGHSNSSLWSATIFPVAQTREESLLMTTRMMEEGTTAVEEGTRRISIQQAIKARNMPEMEKYRKKLRFLD